MLLFLSLFQLFPQKTTHGNDHDVVACNTHTNVQCDGICRSCLQHYDECRHTAHMWDLSMSPRSTLTRSQRTGQVYLDILDMITK